MKHEDIQIKADQLRADAKFRLNDLMGFDPDVVSGEVDLLVDSIIGAAILEVAAGQSKAQDK